MWPLVRDSSGSVITWLTIDISKDTILFYLDEMVSGHAWRRIDFKGVNSITWAEKRTIKRQIVSGLCGNRPYKFHGVSYSTHREKPLCSRDTRSSHWRSRQCKQLPDTRSIFMFAPSCSCFQQVNQLQIKSLLYVARFEILVTISKCYLQGLDTV